MISNFSEVEKSLKRCLKEKVSITAATVVGFLIAGTVAFGVGTPTDVTVTGDGSSEKITITGVGSKTKEITNRTSGKITVGDIYSGNTVIESLAELLTVKVEGTVATITGNYAKEGTYLNTLTITSGNAQGVTFLSTDTDVTSITSDLKVEVTGVNGKPAIAMEATKAGDKVTNTGTIAVKNYAVGMVAGAGATAVNNADSEITVEGDNSAVGMSATTVDGTTTTLTNDGTITVTKGTGIEVKGAGSAVVNGNGNGIVAVIDGIGIDATLLDGSKFNITTGSVTTESSKVGIKVTGATAMKAGTTEAIVTTKLGTTKGTGVAVTGAKNNTITVNLGAADVVATIEEVVVPKAEVSGTGVEITANEAAGKVVVNVNQKDLKVAAGTKLIDVANNAGDITIDAKQAVELVTTANLVNVANNAGGNITVNLDADGQAVAKGSLVNVGVITGTTNVNINKDVVFSDTATHKGSIVKAGALGTDGVLNINLNVTGKDTSNNDKTLTVAEGITALDLENIGSNGVASVKNTGNVTIAKQGTLVNGNAKTTLANQGLITVSVVNESSVDNNSHISKGEGVAVKNYGIIKLAMTSEDFIAKAGSTATEKTLDQLTTEEVTTALKALGVISEGDFSSVGNIQLQNGVFTAAKAIAGENSIDGLNTALKSQEEDKRGFAVAEKGKATIVATPENNKLENVQLTLNGTMTVSGKEEVIVDNSADAKQQIVIGQKGELEITDGATLNYTGNILADKVGDKAAITVADGGTFTLSNGTLTVVEALPSTDEPATVSLSLANEVQENRVGLKLGASVFNLNDSTINADIAGTLVNGTNALQGRIDSTGTSVINNKVTDIATIKVEDGMLKFGANSAIVVSSGAAVGQKTSINLTEGKMGVELGENGNVLSNSPNSIEFEGTYRDGKVVLLTNALTEDTTFELGTHDGLYDGDVTANGDIYYNIVKGDNGIWNAEFNKDALLETTGTKYAELNNMYVATQYIHDLLEKNPSLRIAQLDDLYSNNIYSETVKMSLDTLKMNEDAVLSLNVRPKQGEFTAQGKFLFTSTDYDREGVLKDYKVETKNTGLLGALEYGLTDTSSVGFAFAGTKQDLDMKNGASADGDAFYFGLYRNDKFNNIDLTTGLGYMTDRVDAKSFVGKDKFDSTAFSGYIQGKYNYAIGENLTLSPKARFTVTRFQQDSINTGRMKQEEVKDTMADLELGVELKKEIALETGKMNLLAGASYTTNVVGKDDDFYRVDFLSNTGKVNSTKVKGANLEKNSLKLNLGADVELTNGVFYNGGLSYEFDDEDRDSIGVTLGAGYKF